jgi:dihydrofolate reductase
VFVLTHHARAPLTMAGGTEFRFVTEGIHAALEQARAAAGGRDVRLGGGVATIRQYLRAALIDELHLAVRPVLLGSGEHLLQGIDMRALGYECATYAAGERATHVFLRKRAIAGA